MATTYTLVTVEIAPGRRLLQRGTMYRPGDRLDLPRSEAERLCRSRTARRVLEPR